jgi:TonB family protein
MRDKQHDIEKYLNGELTEPERHAIEKQALRDPFLADALAGAELVNPADFRQDTADLQAKLRASVLKKGFPVWRVAAGVAVAVGLATVAYYYTAKPEPEQLIAKQENRTVPEAAADKDDAKEAPALNPTPDEQASEKEKRVAKPNPTTVDKTTQADLAVADAPELTAAQESEPVTTSVQAGAELPAATTTTPPEPPAAVIEQPSKKTLAREESFKEKLGEQRSVVPATALTARVVTGQVVSAEDGSPLPGVNVTIKGATQGTVTDVEGRFQLPHVQDGTLIFSFIGLQSVEYTMATTPPIVKMPLDVSSLSEIVVTGHGGADAADTRSGPFLVAEPVGGRKAFNDYLQKNMRYPEAALGKKIEGRVTVQFKVQQTGLLSDFAVIKGIGGGCEEELIRLIQTGPAWKAQQNNGQPVAATVRIRYNFRLSDR